MEQKKNVWPDYSKQDKDELERLCGAYRDFLDSGKTERECVKIVEALARKAGYKKLEDVISKKIRIKSGDKVYATGMGKTVALFNMGNQPLEDGLRILGAHIDSPRLDIKQKPLYA